MNPEMLEFFREVGELTGDATVGRGMVTCGVAALATVGVLWRWWRKKPDRIRIDAPAGEFIQVGHRNTGDS